MHTTKIHTTKPIVLRPEPARAEGLGSERRLFAEHHRGEEGDRSGERPNAGGAVAGGEKEAVELALADDRNAIARGWAEAGPDLVNDALAQVRHELHRRRKQPGNAARGD